MGGFQWMISRELKNQLLRDVLIFLDGGKEVWTVKSPVTKLKP